MNDLLELIKQFNINLLNIKDNFSYISQLNILTKREFLVKKSSLDFKQFVNNQLNYQIVINQLTYGNSIINLDLLTDFLLNIIYVKIPIGLYKFDNIEDKMVKDTYQIKEKMIYESFFNLAYISSYLNIFIKFVRDNYDSNFFQRITLYNYQELYNLQSKIEHITRSILKPGIRYYNKNLKKSADVLRIVTSFENQKADLLSFLIDSEFYSNSCIQIYNWYLHDLEIFLELVKNKSPKENISYEEIRVYQEFGNSLKEYFLERIKKLEINVVKK